ncbi:hypothetical protein HNP38_000404 [Chryseobacterium defluvii]|uniref:Uncharacterized protein n=1 Tax=Chryseobacterium defluvii TaxID=160396 RepID=A0A840KDU4_9FLAO|nr:hypothetical protein [Chryseobacterium defluvii]MBB4805132.1 hypothetical protein [Chryseobacterium defluvii]
MKLIVFILFFISLGLNGQTVYKTPSGTKYHLSSCGMVKNVSSALDVSKAVEIGLQPCKVCNPPTVNALGIIFKPKKVNGTNRGNRCPAITKEGTRCKRYTKIGNDYCFQHTPDQ